MNKRGHFGLSKYTWVGNIKRLFAIFVSTTIAFIAVLPLLALLGLAENANICATRGQWAVILIFGAVVFVVETFIERILKVENNRKTPTGF